MLRADDTHAESDGGNVSLARGPQAQDETQRTRRQASLVGVRHDGRIKQRRGLRRVFVGEVSADKRLAVRRSPPIAQIMADFGKSVAEKFINLLVTVLEFAENRTQQPVNLRFRKGHDTSNNSSGNIFGRWAKGPEQNARTIWA